MYLFTLIKTCMTLSSIEHKDFGGKCLTGFVSKDNEDPIIFPFWVNYPFHLQTLSPSHTTYIIL